MRKYKTSQTLHEGDLIETMGQLYVTMPFNIAKPCLLQCDMAGIANHAHCNGRCFRYKNSGSVVFRRVEEPQDDYTVTETRFEHNCRKEMEKLIKTYGQ